MEIDCMRMEGKIHFQSFLPHVNKVKGEGQREGREGEVKRTGTGKQKRKGSEDR